MTQLFNYQVGHYYVYSLSGDQLESSGTFYTKHPEKYAEFIQITKSTTFKRGSGLPGSAWKENQAIFYKNVYKNTNFPRAKVSKDLKVKGGLAFPIIFKGELQGVFEFFSDAEVSLSDEELDLINILSEYINNFIELYKTNRDFKLIFECAGEGIYGLDTKGHTTFINPAACKILGYTAKELIGQSMHSLTHHSYPDGTPYPVEHCHMYQAFNEGKTTRVDDEVLWHRDGHPVPIRYTSTPIYDNQVIQGAVVTFIDISREKQAEKSLKKLALYDTLSDLPNRHYFQSFLRDTLYRARRYKHPLALIYIDLDNFKTINDTLGHHIGDKLIQRVANKLRKSLRGSDFIARLGGDEFAAIIQDIDTEDAIGYTAQKIIDAFDKEIVIDGNQIKVSLSIGVSLFPLSAKDPQTLLKNADIAMYRAKESGKNNFVIFTKELDEAVKRNQAIDAHLRQAIDKKQFYLVYQPIIEISTNKISSVETLIRWKCPELNNPGPDIFIPIAELTNLIEKISLWVFKQALIDMSDINQVSQSNKLNLSINVSSKQLLSHTFVNRINSLLKEHEVCPSQIIIEVTESCVMNDIEKSSLLLNQLINSKVKIAIDDFGTGYSSMLYLKHLPLSYLKIDREFINELPDDHNDAAIVRAINSLAGSLGLEVIAEGVENEQQLQFLSSINADKAQGYYFAKPLTLNELINFIKQHPSNKQ